MLRKSLPILNPSHSFIAALDENMCVEIIHEAYAKYDIMIPTQMKRKPVTGFRIHQRLEAKVILCTKSYQ